MVRRLPQPLQLGVRLFNHALLLGFFAFMVWFGTRFAVDAWENPSPVMRLPLAWLYGPVAFCFALMIVRYLQVLDRQDLEHRRASGKPMWADWLPAILMLVLFALETPIAFAIAISALSFFLIDGNVPLNIFVQKMVTATDSYPLLAIPFFVLAGAIMNKAGITARLLALADAMVGHMTGALAQMCTVLATLLGGLTASSSADAAMLAKVLGPEMVKANYSPAFAAVITSCAAIITALIPPSIGLIIYGYIADVSIGRLFIGGVVPGLLLAASLMAVTSVIARKRGYLPVRRAFRRHGRARTHLPRRAVGALHPGLHRRRHPLRHLHADRSRARSPSSTRSWSAASPMGACRFADLPRVMKETALDTSSVMLMICAASAFGFYLAWERIPPQMAAWLVSLTSEPVPLLLLINVAADRARHRGRGDLGPDHPHADLRADPREARHRPGAFRHRSRHQPDHRRGDAAGRADDVHLVAGAAGADGGLHHRGPALPRRHAHRSIGSEPVPAADAVPARSRLRQGPEVGQGDVAP